MLIILGLEMEHWSCGCCSLTDVGSPEMTNRSARGGFSAQSTRKPHLPLSKATSKQAESVLAEKSPKLSPVGSVERQFQVSKLELPDIVRLLQSEGTVLQST